MKFECAIARCRRTALLAIAIAGLHLGSLATAIEPAKSIGLLADNQAVASERPSDNEPKPDSSNDLAVREMVKAHLPQLEPVLERLRKAQPQDYEKAVRDLSRSARRLELAKKRDDGLYELELRTLKAQIDVNLLTARIKVRDSDRDRKRLKAASADLYRTSIDRAAYEVNLIQSRIEKMQRQLAAAKGRLETKQKAGDDAIESAYTNALRRAGRK